MPHQRLLLCCVSSSASPRLPVATHLGRVRGRARARARVRVILRVRSRLAVAAHVPVGSWKRHL